MRNIHYLRQCAILRMVNVSIAVQKPDTSRRPNPVAPRENPLRGTAHAGAKTQDSTLNQIEDQLPENASCTAEKTDASPGVIAQPVLSDNAARPEIFDSEYFYADPQPWP